MGVVLGSVLILIAKKQRMHFLLFLIAPVAYTLECYDCVEIDGGSSSCSDATVTECKDSCMTKSTFDGERVIYIRYCGEVDAECNKIGVTCDACIEDLCNDLVFTTTKETVPVTMSTTTYTEETTSGFASLDFIAIMLLLINQLL